MILRTFSLSKFFDGLKALDRVNIEVEEGKITLVIGPNGSGKTTLINVITGFYKADEGKVEYKGEDITNKPPHELYRRGIVRTFQIPKPLKKLTVLENLLIARENPGEGIVGALTKAYIPKEKESVTKAFEILEFLGIEHLWDEEAQNLSGGQLRLVEIGRALMSDADLFVMDEPLAGVAPKLSHDILGRMRELCEMGKTFLIVEHRLDIVLEYVDKVYVMASGRIIAEGKGKEVIEKPEVVEVYLGA